MAETGVTITFAAPMVRRSLRARNAQALATLLGIKVPGRIGATAEGIACLGPDEWLLRLPEGSTIPSGAGLPMSVTDISDRQVALVLEGPRAVDLLQSGCPRDISRLAVGEARRTVYEGVEVVVLRTGEDCFAVEVWRSFAPYLHLALAKAAAHT